MSVLLKSLDARFAKAAQILPGLAACSAIALIASLLQALQVKLFGRAALEALVIAILLGAGLRIVWRPGPAFRTGIAFSAKIVLEIAVVFLGASITTATLFGVGAPLLIGIAVVVCLAIAISYTLGRRLGLSRDMAMLIACGNAICGNSAIAAVAPVINAEAEDVTASIAFTAILGIGVVLGLPVLGGALAMSEHQFGALAGLTVYAVPQVLAATTPVGALAVRFGALIKLVRVLMLGPVVIILSVLFPAKPNADAKPRKFNLSQLVPWFIVGFLALTAARSMNLLPLALLPVLAEGATGFAVISMAALGLSADFRALVAVGPRAALTVVLSLLSLGGISLALIRLLHLA